MPRKTLAAAALLMLCAGAHAEWKQIADSAFGTMSYDPASVKTQDGRTHLQYRIDFPIERRGAQGKTYRSATMNVAVDCKAATVSVLDLRTNAETEGRGAVVEQQTLPPSPGEKVATDSSNAAIFKAACPGVPVPVKAADSTPAQPAKAAPAKK